MTALNLSIAQWRKSSCSTDVSNCVEVEVTDPAIAVRNFKTPHRKYADRHPNVGHVHPRELRNGD